MARQGHLLPLAAGALRACPHHRSSGASVEQCCDRQLSARCRIETRHVVAARRTSFLPGCSRCPCFSLQIGLGRVFSQHTDCCAWRVFSQHTDCFAYVVGQVPCLPPSANDPGCMRCAFSTAPFLRVFWHNLCPRLRSWPRDPDFMSAMTGIQPICQRTASRAKAQGLPTKFRTVMIITLP